MAQLHAQQPRLPHSLYPPHPLILAARNSTPAPLRVPLGPMHIRPVQPDDFDAIAALTNHYIVNTAIHFGYEPVTAEALRQAWLASRDIYPYLVAEIPGPQGRPVFAGYAKAGRWRERDAYRFIAETGIYIEQSIQGRGVGARLYQALIDACRDAGFHSLIGVIGLPNDPSIRLHEAVGFVDAGVIKRAGWKFDRWYDVACYQYMLRDEAHRPV